MWTRDGLTTFYILVAMRLNTRRVEIAGITAIPDGDWVRQMARNLTACGGFLDDASHLLIDRDTKFLPLRTYLNDMTDTDVVLLPPRSPNLNAHLERYMRSLKSECLDRMIFFGRRSLERALEQFVAHYHGERNHQGLGNRIIDPGDEVGKEVGDVRCRERLGGMLRYYHREAVQVRAVRRMRDRYALIPGLNPIGRRFSAACQPTSLPGKRQGHLRLRFRRSRS